MPPSRAFTSEEVNRILRAAPPPRDLAMLTTLATTGLRISEVLKLTWDSVCDVQGQVRPYMIAPVSKSRKHNQTRLIPTAQALIRPMMQLRAAHPDLQPCAYLFRTPGPGNYPITARQASRILHSVTDPLAIPPGYGTHSFRKWLAQEIYRRSEHDLTLVQVALGHKNPASTLYYLSVDSQKLRWAWAGALSHATGQGFISAPKTIRQQPELPLSCEPSHIASTIQSVLKKLHLKGAPQ